MPRKKQPAKRKAAPKPKSVPPEATAAAVEALTEPVERLPAIPDVDLLSTGCTVLNMAFSGRPGGGIPKGTYLYTVGDSGALKSWLGFNLFAEANLNPYFDGYDFVFDNAENGMLADIPRYFGQGVLDRMRPPKGTLVDPTNSTTVQEFYFHLAAACRRPCIYLLDSMDALNDDADDEKFAAELYFHETGKGEKDIPGSMGMQKAKTNSKNINRVVQGLRDTGSILVIISQTRDKIGARFPTKTRGGGHALQFYAHLNVWTSKGDEITRRYLNKDRVVGAKIKVDVRKNRVTGWEDVVVVHHLKEYGLDDIGASTEYLLAEKHWHTVKETAEVGEGTRFAAPEFDFTGTKEQLAKHLIDTGREWDLSVLVAKVWREIMAGAAPYRRPKYGV